MRQRLAIAVIVLGGAAIAGLAARGVASDLATPRDLHEREYVGSGECRRCHPVHHESWSRTFHRTMTQDARTPGAVLGAFDGRSVEYGGITSRMERDGERFVITSERDGEAIDEVEIDRTVGSHRYQQYLARRGDAWWRLPIAWDVAEQRFVHMNAAFLTADPEGLEEGAIALADHRRHVTRWNDNCVFCHNVAPDPGLDPVTQRFTTEVAELGIGCEACHGPGSEHVARNRDPLRRYVLHGSDEPDPTIVSPARLDPARRADLCGRCHGQRITDDVDAFLAHGDPFVPGDDLALYSSPLWHDTVLSEGTLAEREGVFAARFWGDGTPRLTAYEYQGLLQSRCASEGALTCTDCHGMHDGDPRGQLRPSVREGDAMCAGACHAELVDRAAAQQHARHEDVRCVDCHMPRIVYGVRDVHRSHRIDVPRPVEDAEAGRADACTLCHLERDDSLLTTGVGGDPVQRAVIAAAAGREESATPRSMRLGALLATMRDDSYPAIRHLAWRSVRALVPLDASAFTATDPRDARIAAVARIEAMIDEPIDAPSPEQLASLRARARDVAIEIGE
ncbi:ammonia-forming cytochrome c nitrite reductase subunit c552 [Sandaracinus amylolyticus]|uniref:ammonia-forming cytochrome c nitrite reductase subunit c552 n=1 Tax=Sandaracinus amylolyticus TaxID=927083 RepID=UPI001F008DCF|nr:ammonia-forming cytochrome c nitrite reductase subunit c552 [Sandaracinus amylolyticus]UJR80969.1 Ammonia-forming cytochrome c nitrite reductase subunit c552 [Sandaracinus amylolyticus]